MLLPPFTLRNYPSIILLKQRKNTVVPNFMKIKWKMMVSLKKKRPFDLTLRMLQNYNKTIQMRTKLLATNGSYVIHFHEQSHISIRSCSKEFTAVIKHLLHYPYIK